MRMDQSVGTTQVDEKKKKGKIIIYICFCYLFQKLMIYYYTCKKHFKELLNEGGDSENQIAYFVIMIYKWCFDFVNQHR